ARPQGHVPRLLLVRAELLPTATEARKAKEALAIVRWSLWQALSLAVRCLCWRSIRSFPYERLRCDRTRKLALAHRLPYGAKPGAAQVRCRSWRLARAYRLHRRRLDHHRGLLQAAIGGTLRRPRPQADDGSRRTFFRGAAVFLSVRARSLVATCAALR